MLGLFRDQREVLLETERALLDSQSWANAARDAAEAGAAAGVRSAGTETPNPVAALDDATTATYVVSDVPVTACGEAHSIHTIKATTAAVNAAGDPIVLIHGYAQGGASWWRNLPTLAMKHRSGTVLAPDWLGCGGSSRPTWTAGDDGEAAEDFMADSFEQWREEQGLERMHLVAHSMVGSRLLNASSYSAALCRAVLCSST